jgi:hypothetical protein
MGERDTYRANTEARADVAAHGPRANVDSALLRYLAAAAYHEADREHERADHGNEEAADDDPTTAREPGAEHR